MSDTTVNLRDKLHTIHGRLYQAQMWRRYAMAWCQRKGMFTERAWVELVLKVSYEDCLRRARANLYLAKRIRRRELEVTRPTTPRGGNQ